VQALVFSRLQWEQQHPLRPQPPALPWSLLTVPSLRSTALTQPQPPCWLFHQRYRTPQLVLRYRSRTPCALRVVLCRPHRTFRARPQQQGSVRPGAHLLLLCLRLVSTTHSSQVRPWNMLYVCHVGNPPLYAATAT
jgi:hypothetical protein